MNITTWIVKEWITDTGKSFFFLERTIMGQVYDDEVGISGD
jgi:hypothetical protein